MAEINQLETDEYGLYIHADNYQECVAINKKAERRRKAWKALPWWRKLFIDHYKWYLKH